MSIEMLNVAQIHRNLLGLYNTKSRNNPRKRLQGYYWIEKLPNDALLVGVKGSDWKYEEVKLPGRSYTSYKRVKLKSHEVSFKPEVVITSEAVTFVEFPRPGLLRALSGYVDISTRKPKTNQHLGMQVRVMNKPWHWGATDREEVLNAIGEGNFKITDQGIVFDQPLRTRTFNSEKQNALNRTIIKVRRAIRARTKLGAFNSITLDSIEKRNDVQVATKSYWTEPGRTFHACLEKVDVHDLESFYPLLVLSAKGTYDYYNRRSTEINWIKLFNNAVHRNKEALLRHTGAVVYC